MNIFRGLCAALALYSRIPMPRLEFKEGDMRRALVYFPTVGAIIGFAVVGIAFASARFELPLIASVALATAAPILITGGFHLDGFMDVEDALRSYQSRERKLEILKDPHIGAFAVVATLRVGLIWVAALAVLITDMSSTAAFACFFYVSRASSAALAITLRHARHDGMLAAETKGAGRFELTLLVAQLFAGIFVAALCDWRVAIGTTVAAFGVAWRYRRLCYREFGGVTGDTAGYYVTTSEVAAASAAAVVSVMTRLGG